MTRVIFVVLGEGQIFGINGSSALGEIKFSISFTKPNPKFCLSLHYNADIRYLFVNEKVIFKKFFKLTIKMSNPMLPQKYI